MPRVVECEICAQGIRGEALQSYAMQKDGGGGMLNRILRGDIGGYVAGTVVDGALGAGGLVAARQARGLVGAMIPGGDDPTIEAATDAGLALVIGGVAERFVPGMAGRGRQLAATAVSLAITAALARVTGMAALSPVALKGVNVPPERFQRTAGGGVGAIDHNDRTEHVVPPPTRVSNIAGVV